MKKLSALLLLGFLILGCNNKPISTSREGEGVEVEFLFEKDGVRVYRFRDGGRQHYFTSSGETISTQGSGKHHYEENINYEGTRSDY